MTESYHAYAIVTRTALPSWPSHECRVVRRFKDVVALSDALAAALPGCMLPARPKRDALGARRAGPDFLEARRAALERYLNRLARHAQAASSEVVQVWLAAADVDVRACAAWARLQPPAPCSAKSLRRLLKQLVGRGPAAPTASEAARPAADSGDVLRMARERLAALQGVTKAVPPSPLERELRDEAARLEEVRRLLGGLAAKGGALAAAVRSAAAATSDMARALEGLAAYEQGHGRSAEAALEAGAAVGMAQVAGARTQAAAQAAAQLAPVADLLAATPGALGALEARERALLTALTLEHDLARAQAGLEAAQAPGAAAAARVASLTASTAALAEAAGAARGEYSRLAARNAEEVRAWRGGMRADLLGAARGLAGAQAASAEREQALWLDLHARLSALSLR